MSDLIGRRRARALARCVALALLAAVPAVLVLLYLNYDLRSARRTRLAASVTQQAALVRADMQMVLEGARQLGRAIARLPVVQALGPGCRQELRELLAELPPYAGLSVVDSGGRVVCSTDTGDDSTGDASAILAALRAAAAIPPVVVGGFTPGAGALGPTLALGVPFGADDPAGGRAVVVLGLSLDWLGRHLGASLAAAGGQTFVVADATGIVLARRPGRLEAGQSLPAELLPHVGAAQAGVAVLEGADGLERLAGFTRAGPPGGRLFVAVDAPVPDVMSELDRATWHGSLLVGLGALLSMWLAVLAGVRFVRRPTAALLDAARRWSAGDLGARARVPGPPEGSFGRLAAAFNAMAEGLGRQRAELLELNTTLEARVAARTRDLVASRNQLQVEIVEREKTEGELRQAQKLQAVGQLAGGIAHDFNNLLSIVTGALDLLRRRLGPAQAGAAALVENAAQAAERGVRLTAQLLAFARRQRLLPAATDLNKLVGDLPGLVAGMLGRDIAIRTSLAPDLWPALVDPGQLEAALLNLVLNARDAMPGGGTLSIATANVLVPDDVPAGPGVSPGAYVAVRMGDTGTGMAPHVLARVFEPFFTTKPAGSASGLGLSQVHGMALQSGGDVRIDSRPDAGTTVTLLLPRATGALAAPRAAVPRGLRILVADDDGAVRRMTCEILDERGHHPVAAADATQALAILEKDLADTGGSFDVLLADYVMPGMNGVALILMARALQPRMKALLVTGHAEFEGSETLRAEAIMRKPFTIAQLDERLQRMMREAQPEAAPAVAG